MTADTYLKDVVIPVDATLSRYTKIVLTIISNGHYVTDAVQVLFIIADMPPIVGYCPWKAPLRAVSFGLASVINKFLLNHVM